MLLVGVLAGGFCVFKRYRCLRSVSNSFIKLSAFNPSKPNPLNYKTRKNLTLIFFSPKMPKVRLGHGGATKEEQCRGILHRLLIVSQLQERGVAAFRCTGDRSAQ